MTDQENKIIIRSVVEIAGYPESFVDQTMENVAINLRKNEAMTVLEAKKFPTKAIDKMFSTFTEFDLEFKQFDDVLAFCFNVMPSSIEILEGKSSFESTEVVALLNDVLGRLHEYDMVVKNLRANVVLLEKKVAELTKK